MIAQTWFEEYPIDPNSDIAKILTDMFNIFFTRKSVEIEWRLYKNSLTSLIGILRPIGVCLEAEFMYIVLDTLHKFFKNGLLYQPELWVIPVPSVNPEASNYVCRQLHYCYIFRYHDSPEGKVTNICFLLGATNYSGSGGVAKERMDTFIKWLRELYGIPVRHRSTYDIVALLVHG